jgi:hypothetical protein
MNIRILNYTGITFRIKWGTTRETIGCNSEKTIQIEPSQARLTRFFARYKSIPESPVRIKGQINIIFSSDKVDNTLILGAFTEGSPKYIGCISVNEAGRYLYNEYDRSKLEQQYVGAKFYNIPVELYFDNGVFTRLKKLYYLTFNSAHCENRDGPMCDKVMGMPVLIILFIILVTVVITVVTVIVLGYINTSKLKV